jgi:hypothetical protein
MFSCPYESYCGTLDLETIIPFFSGETRQFTRVRGSNGLVYFGSGHTCRYRIKFPMDAGVGDNIYFKIDNLKMTKITIGLGTEFDNSALDGQTFLFTESVNGSGGYVKYPYPYFGFMVIEYDPT